jgi:hypothetical protein
MFKGAGYVKDNKNYEADNELSQSQVEQQDVAVDPFTRLMFGGNPPNRTKYQEHTYKSDVATDNKSDYYQLMEQIDEIMGSVDRIKPIINELTPLLNFFRKSK